MLSEVHPNLYIEKKLTLIIYPAILREEETIQNRAHGKVFLENDLWRAVKSSSFRSKGG